MSVVVSFDFVDKTILYYCQIKADKENFPAVSFVFNYLLYNVFYRTYTGSILIVLVVRYCK